MSKGPFQFGSDVWPGTAKLVEELGELQQVLGKLLQLGGSTQHWDGDLRLKLVEEIADAKAALNFFVVGMTPEEMKQISERADAKYNLFCAWHVNPDHPSDNQK